MRLGRGGDTLAGYAARDYSRLAAAAAVGCPNAIIQAGINDDANATTALANTLSLANDLLATGVVQRVFGTTKTPYTVSADQGATQAPQTNEAGRLALNTALRAAPAPLSGTFEIARTVDPTDSGLWPLVNQSAADLLHPTPATAAIMAGGIVAGQGMLLP